VPIIDLTLFILLNATFKQTNKQTNKQSKTNEDTVRFVGVGVIDNHQCLNKLFININKM
jgi:uncharacterized membrane protein